MENLIPKLATIILTAGLSSRMGKFKPMMHLGEKTLIEHIISTHQAAGIQKIYVVTGHRALDIKRKTAPYGIKIVHNIQYQNGMFSSVLAGITKLSKSTKYFFIHPVDIPLVRLQTIIKLIKIITTKKIDIVHPTFKNKRGHPPLISTNIKNFIIKWKQPGGLRQCLKKYGKNSVDIPVADQGILMDADTQNNFCNLSLKFQEKNILTPTECKVLMKQIVSTPNKIIQHCNLVAQIAVKLAKSINNTTKLQLNISLIESSALTHDMARTQKNHAKVGGEMLKQLGYKKMGEIVEQHMDIIVHKKLPITESEVVYIADKLVCGNKLVNLDTRLSKIKKRYKDCLVLNNITHRMSNANKIKNKIETITHKTIEQIVENSKL